MNHTLLVAPGDRFFEEVRDSLLTQLALVEQPVRNLERVWYDSFDSRLRNKGLILEQESHGKEYWLTLRHLNTGEISFHVPVPKPVRFCTDLPAGVFRDKLFSLLKYRALLPVSSASCHSVSLLLKDSEDKVKLRIDLEDLQLNHQARKSSHIYALIRPVRGHRGSVREIQRYLRKKLAFKFCDIDPVLLANPSSQYFPENYSSRVKLKLRPDERADRAVGRVLRRLLKIKKQNEAGMLQRLDTEFLHDFRIAIRQSRSLLVQIRHLYPPAQVNVLKKDFAWLSTRTSDLRDYDVFLLKFERYEKELPWDMREHLLPLREYLRKLQKQQQRQLQRTLTSVRYQQFMQRWETLLEKSSLQHHVQKNSDREIISLASETIWRVYCKLINQGKKIGPSTHIDALHELRKTGKKLRYLIECFATLYNKKQITRVVAELTSIQDVLGNLTDLDVQKNLLHKWAIEMSEADLGSQQTIGTIHTLETVLEKRKEKKLAEFSTSFSQSITEEKQALFRQLFAKGI